MALDNAQFIAELSITDPPGTDPLSQGDDQIRTAKRAVFQSFPNIDAAVTLTTAQMNEAAIKNEANVFTVDSNQFTDLNILKAASPATQAGWLFQDDGGFNRWQLQRYDDNLQDGDFVLIRRDGLGAFTDEPFRINAISGIIDFAQVPTVAGAPLWIAGELRMFVAAATPGTNWFIADGTNGTVNLDNRVLTGEGLSSPGTLLAPNLVGTAASTTTGNTAISVAQLPAHTHKIWSGNQSGITDTTFSHVSVETVCGANRSNTGPFYDEFNSVGTRIIENTGSGSGHNHPQVSAAVTENGSDRNTVRPLSAVVQYHQYVP